MTFSQLPLFGQPPRRILEERGLVEYFPCFIADHQRYFDGLVRDVHWTQNTINMYGKRQLIPRLNAWYGDPGANITFSGITFNPMPWVSDLLTLKQQVETWLGCQFNSVLANYYRDGNDSVAWHSDDEKELGPTPLIASLSLGANRRFSLRPRFESTQTTQHIDLEGGSLLVMSGETQANWSHQIAKTKKTTQGRINLTFRQIIRQC